MKTITNSTHSDVFELPSFPASIETDIVKKWEKDLDSGSLVDSETQTQLLIPYFSVHDQAARYGRRVKFYLFWIGAAWTLFSIITSPINYEGSIGWFIVTALLTILVGAIIYGVIGWCLGYVFGLPFAFAKKKARKVAEKKKIIDDLNHRFTNNPQFFYSEVIAYLKFQIDSIDAKVSKKKGEVDQRFKVPRREIELEIAQGYLDLNELMREKDSKFVIASKELEESLKILEEKTSTLSPDEIDLLSQIRDAESQIKALNNLVVGLNAKKSFYDDHAAVFSRIAKLKQLARSDGYQSQNATNADPMLVALRAELDEINAELRKVIGQAVEVSSRPLLSGATQVERLIAS